MTDDGSSFTCTCEAGYYGDFCELDEQVNGLASNPKAVLTLNAETKKNLKMLRNVAGLPYDRYGYEPLAMLYKFSDGKYSNIDFWILVTTICHQHFCRPG